ncbi:SAM-dependent chlorinase/fluorinase [Bacteroidales bacterium OttesenSCG-928-K03]|nr:SAM-dependent chlorinase/fluorinase [Odoribacter sp. OttesenSCG-928-L07]MDL2239446.1 SAM-dependent chlorinase/fluorinase [Bacteroidales bacterium OttesenSCG-928-L14]MDL2240567.1 SAM-dependent chlorinase/fluorinase [Bacteroidales bacterium OttesenSCG-928-K22]MDL2242651.1 SAM-dependent chlorinase/fluorinase [Bacteroidales bacterium OttesenSCG-928-K03]
MVKKIITLLTDFGNKDHYVAAIKGTIFSRLPDVNIVDISHDITPFNTREAAFVLSNSYKFFPKGTIHIIGVNSEASIETPHILVKADDQFFICADNGILPIVFYNKEVSIYEIDFIQESPVFTFSTKDVFAEIAILIAAGENYSQYLRKQEGFKKNYITFQPIINGDILQGHILLIDNYQNIITNITKEIFQNFVKKSPYEILVTSNKIGKISTGYSDAKEADIVVLFGSHGYLEVAMNKSNGAELLGIDYRSNILVQRY